jgi:hypothetical protein
MKPIESVRIMVDADVKAVAVRLSPVPRSVTTSHLINRLCWARRRMPDFLWR